MARIRTPLHQRWNHFRMGLLPFLSFLGCLVLTLWLWKQQVLLSGVVGEVEPVTVDVAAGAQGIISTSSAHWNLFAKVKKGDVIARLDDSLLQATKQTLEAEQKKIEAEIDSARTSFALDKIGAEQTVERMKLETELAVRQLALRRREVLVQIAVDEKEVERIKVEIAMEEKLSSSGAGNAIDLTLLQRQYDVIYERLSTTKNLLLTIEREGAKAVAERNKMADLEFPKVDALLEPITAAVDVQKARLKELEVQFKNLEILAPVDGVVTFVHKRPGESVQPGDPVVTIANEDSQYIICYVREHQLPKPQDGMSVEIRLRQPGSKAYYSTVETVGPQVSPVPPHQLADQATPEWAFPCKIPIPSDLATADLKPGELVEVIFRGPKK